MTRPIAGARRQRVVADPYEGAAVVVALFGEADAVEVRVDDRAGLSGDEIAMMLDAAVEQLVDRRVDDRTEGTWGG